MFMSSTGPLDLTMSVNIPRSLRGLAQYEVLRDSGPVRLLCEVRGKSAACSTLMAQTVLRTLRLFWFHGD